MAQVHYTVDFVDGAWKVGLNGKAFGPYSTLETAVAAASKACHQAEVQGYEAFLTINSFEDTPAAESEADAEGQRDAA